MKPCERIDLRQFARAHEAPRNRHRLTAAVAAYEHTVLVAGSDAGGERAAAIYSLLGSAKLNGIDPEAYMTAVLRSIAGHPIRRIEELLTWNLSPETAAKAA